jgi:7-keto-8-aminopelargonate synthetase-like enzyme
MHMLVLLMVFVCTWENVLPISTTTLESMEKNLQRATKMATETGGGILFITEGVFGMRGQQGKLKEIVALKDKYNFRLLG